MSNESGVGNIMSDGRNRAIKSIILGASIFVYLSMLLYSGVHNWALMSKGVPPDMLIWAALGVLALEVSAVFLPLALHFWTHAPLQRYAALAFYVVDLGLMFLNVVLDYSVNRGATIPGWMTMYFSFIVPATPVIAGIGWTLLWLLDPSQKERATIEMLRASTREALAARITAQANQTDVSEMVEEAAAQMARDVIAKTLGVSVGSVAPGAVARKYLPKDTIFVPDKRVLDEETGAPEDLESLESLEKLGVDEIDRPNSNGKGGAKIYRTDAGRVETIHPLD